MGKAPQRATNPEALHNLTIRISGEQKNQILDAAFASGYSVTQYILYALWTFMRSQEGIPSPGPSQFLRASKEDMLKAYLTGETLLMPCGKPKCDIKEITFNGLIFCETCNVRIS